MSASEGIASIDYLAAARAPADRRRLPLMDKPAKKSGNILDIHARAREVMRLHIAGWKNVEIARQVGCTPQTVSNILNSPKVIEEVAKLQAAKDEKAVSAQTADEKLKELQMRAVSTLEEVLTGEMDATPELIVKTATEILDRGGNSKVQRVAGSVTHTHLSIEDIMSIRKEIEARPPLTAGGETAATTAATAAIDITESVIEEPAPARDEDAGAKAPADGSSTDDNEGS